jgi:hypothetical protein
VPVDATVIVAIEVGLGDEIADLVEGVVVEQQAADQRLLGLDRMRRYLERQELRIASCLVRGLRLRGACHRAPQAPSFLRALRRLS